ncbi:hypothetical protein Goari_019752 [Gossypium aridum]|uniref:Uncharacterized protein n=1 Tax=Gossypium aridum TaxID=34290 RepID=A0A7J8WTL5_GOSAI|nr:hypothetical protein [Gossypium aridum]
MYSPYESELEVWPSPIGVQQVLPKVNMIPELEQRKNMVNQESFLSQMIVKVVEQLKKNCKDNWEKEITQVINICSKGVVHGLNVWDINDLKLLHDEKMSYFDKRMDAFAMTPLLCSRGIVITIIVYGCTATIDDGNAQSDAKDRYKRHRAIGCE